MQNIASFSQVQGCAAHTVSHRLRHQLPSLDLSKRRFVDAMEARSYLEQPLWRPLSKSHGVPQTQDDRLPYVKKVHDAMVDISAIADELDWETKTKTFHTTGGMRGAGPICIEAIAHQVVEMCATMYDNGVSPLVLGRFTGLRQVTTAGRVFTFAQRIYFMYLLLRHFKFHANQVMQSSFTTQYLARVRSTL
jgi:hypothetical protein